MSGPELLEAVGNAERERAAAPDEVPLGEWEALRVRPAPDAPLTSQALLADSDEARGLLQARRPLGFLSTLFTGCSAPGHPLPDHQAG